MYSTTRMDPIRWRAVAAMFGAIMLLSIAGAALSLRSTASARPEPQAIIMVATPTMQAAPSARAVLGYFDYGNPRSAVALNQGDIARVIGLADGWRLVETRQGGRAWVLLADVPPGVPANQPLADLSPPTIAPTAVVIYVPVPIEQAPAPTVEHRVGEKPLDRPAPPTRVAPQQGR